VFDAPLDAVYVWIALGAVSLVVAGTVFALPTASPAAAAAVADAVDSVAASTAEARDEVYVSSGRLRIRPHGLTLRTDGGRAHAQFRYGPVVPAEDGRLRRVLAGRPVAAVFEDSEAFQRAVGRARERAGFWQEAPIELRISRVSWGGVDATLVG
jgi:hypothetical protein